MFLPLGDENFDAKIPWGVSILILINILFFLYVNYSFPIPVDQPSYNPYNSTRTSLLPPEEKVFTPYLENFLPEHDASHSSFWITLLSMFTHASWTMLLANILVLWIFGDNLEDSLGILRIILIYIVSGLMASIIAGVLLYLVDSSYNFSTIGSSGAIAGIIGAYCYMYPKNFIHIQLNAYRSYFGKASLVLSVWLLFELTQVLKMEISIETFLLHFLGFAVGFVMAWAMGKKEKRQDFMYGKLIKTS